jgi:chromosome segregation ATPase
MRAFDDLPDPLGRLEELEIIVDGHAKCIENISKQQQSHALMIEQMSEYLVELARALNSQHKLILSQGKQIRKLENEISNPTG